MRKTLYFFISLIIPFTSIYSNSLYEGTPVHEINIELVKTPPRSQLKPQQIKNKLKTKEGAPFSQENFDNDLKFLSGQYTTIHPILSQETEGLTISLHLTPKPWIRSLSIQGNVEAKTSRLLKTMEYSANRSFDLTELIQAVQKVKAYYIRKGFFEANIQHNIAYIDDEHEVDITISVKEGRSGKIDALIFHGISKKEENDLLEKIMHSPYSMLTSWLTNKGKLNQEMMDQDRLLMIHHLQDQGYADAQVTLEIKELPQRNRIQILIFVDKGDLYSINKISIPKSSLFSKEQIHEMLKLHKGMPYSSDSIRKGMTAIDHGYGKKGYIDAYITYQATLLPESHQYNLTFKLTEGNIYRVGLIKVLGNVTTQTHVILNECLLIPGELFNSTKLKKTETRLKNVGYFSSVNVYSVKSSDDVLGKYFRDVVIEVSEGDTAVLGLSLGASTTEKIFGTIKLSEKNFNYKGLPGLFSDGIESIRGGGEYFSTSINVGQKSTTYALSWSKPYFMDTLWAIGFNVNKTANRAYSSNYDVDTLAFTLYANYEINAFLRFGVHYRFKNAHINGKGVITDERLEDEISNSGLISAIGTTLSYDSTNSFRAPTEGLRSDLGFEYVGLGGDHTFFSTSYTNSFYHRVLENGVMKYRLDFRYLFPLADTTSSTIPLDERLFLGGESSIRGYRAFHVGPKYTNGAPRGGISSALWSVEYDYTLGKRAHVFTFLDMGQVTLDQFGMGHLNSSYGFGVRLKLFDGGPPLTLGMGFPVNPNSPSDVKHFFLNLGIKF